MMNEKTENELLAEMRAGSEEAFEAIFAKYSARVYGLIKRFTKNTEDAEEAFQDCFVTLHRKIDSFKGQSSFSSWLYRVAANCAFMKLRKARSISRHIQFDMPFEDDNNETKIFTDEGMFARRIEQRSMLKAAETILSGLPSDYKRIFVLRELQKYSTREVAKELGVSTASIKAKLFRARNLVENGVRELGLN